MRRLLEVQHDIDALRARTADEWKRLFDKRVGTTEWPFGSGVWGKKEWIMPTMADDNVVSMYEGNSNLFWAERLWQAGRRFRAVGEVMRQQSHRQL